jgi:hypothetical protein
MEGGRRDDGGMMEGLQMACGIPLGDGWPGQVPSRQEVANVIGGVAGNSSRGDNEARRLGKVGQEPGLEPSPQVPID